MGEPDTEEITDKITISIIRSLCPELLFTRFARRKSTTARPLIIYAKADNSAKLYTPPAKYELSYMNVNMSINNVKKESPFPMWKNLSFDIALIFTFVKFAIRALPITNAM